MRTDPSAAPVRKTVAAAPAAGRPLFILLNTRAGSGDREGRARDVRAVLDAAGQRYEMRTPGRHEAVESVCEALAREAAAAGGALVAAGGDGTVNACVNAARERDVPLGLLPMGTFNYFAREHGIPSEPAQAARVLIDGALQPVSMGEVNGRLFFNNVGFGLYTELMRQREQAKRRFGRYRLVAAISGAVALLRGQRPFSLVTVADETQARQTTSMVFVACNAFQLEVLGLNAAGCTKAGSLAVVMLRPTVLHERLRLLLRSAVKQLDQDGRLESFCATDFEVHSARRLIEVVADGETLRLRPPLRFRAAHDVVRLIVPRAEAPSAPH